MKAEEWRKAQDFTYWTDQKADMFAAEQLRDAALKYRNHPGMDTAYSVADDLTARAEELLK